MSETGKILLIDDEPQVLAALKAVLQADGHVLAEAHSGERALEVYPEFQPDVVLLDVKMTGIDGFETCRRLRKAYGVECAPIIFITSKMAPQDIAQGFAAGGVDYVGKPCRTNEVRARIQSHLRNYLLGKERRSLVDRLSRAAVAKNRFIGMAAHDMRNPLVSIRGFAEFLSDGTVGSLATEQLALVKIIRATSQSMIDTLNELLDVATIESGELKLHLAPHNLAELIAKSVAIAKIEAAKKRTRLVFTSDLSGPVLTIDADKMRQVVVNLLSNAVKFSPAGSVVTILIQVAPDGATCRFAVQDQGPGIPEGERHKLFKAFGTLSVQPTLNEKTTGLGLAICGKIVEAHRGTIAVENLPERGCEFSVTLPMAQ